MSSSKNSLKRVSYHEMIENSSLIALASDKEIILSIGKVKMGASSKFKTGKAPAISWDKNPRNYSGYSDKIYGSAVICSYIEKLDLYLAIIDLDVPKNDEDIPMEGMVNASKEWMSKTHTKITPSGGYHIYLLSKEKPELRQPSFNLDYQTNTGNRKGKYVVNTFRYGIQDKEGNKINLDEHYKENGKVHIKDLNFIKEHYEHFKDSPEDILVVNSSDEVLTNIIKDLKDQGLYKPRNSLSEKNKLMDDKFLTELVDVFKPYVKEGQRQDIALVLSGYLHKKSIPLAESEKVFNALFVDDEEIYQRLDLLHSTFEKNKSDVAGLEAIKELLSPVDVDKVKKLITNRSKHRNMSKSDVDNTIDDIDDKISYYLNKWYTVSGKMIVESMEKENTLYFEPDNLKYYVKEGDKKFIDEMDYKFVRNHCNEKFGFNEISRNQTKNCLDHVTRLIEKDYNQLEFTNGSLRITRDELNFSESNFSTDKIPKVKLPFKWNPNANGGEIEKTIHNTLEYNKEGFENNSDTFLKCVGHSFMGTIEKAIFVIILGKPGTGKSTLLTMLKRCLSYSEVSIPDIIKNDRFTLYPTVGKDINIDDDLQSSTWKGIGKLNTFISGNWLYTEVKGENERISLTTSNTPKLWGASNSLPPVVGDGFERRLILIKAENIIDPSNIKDNFQSDILNGVYDEELEWLVYTSITKYVEVRDRPIVGDKATKAMLNEYKFKSDPIKKCIEFIFIKKFDESANSSNYLTVSKVNNEVQKWFNWALTNDIIYDEHKTPSSRNIKNGMDRAGYLQGGKRIESGESPVRCYKNVILNPDWENLWKEFFKE